MKYNPQSQYQTEESPTILDKRSWDSTATFIFFCHNLGSLLKQWILFKILLQFPLPPPPPYTKMKLRKKNLESRVQHCLWGEKRGWTCVKWKTPQKSKSFPRLLSMIVDTTVWRTSTAQRSFSLRAIASWNKLNEDPKRYEHWSFQTSCP